MAFAHWPLFDLRIRTPRLELRPDWDEGLVPLATLAAEGIHDPASMPFTIPWTDNEPGGPLERTMCQFYWRQRAEWTPQQWHCSFVVQYQGKTVGVQGLLATDFAKTRVVETGSWLGLAHHGQGIGTEMRAAVLHLAFVGLGAQRAVSGAWQDNVASLGVSRRLGYADNGDVIKLRRDRPDRIVSLLLTRRDWEANRFAGDIQLVGLDACLPLFGVGDG